MNWRTIYLVVFLSIALSTFFGTLFAPIARTVVATVTVPPVILAASETTAPPASSNWSLTVVGDIMLDRYMRTTIQKNGADFPWKNIKDQLTGDVVLANLEGPFTNHASVATDTHLIFTFDPSLAPSLKTNGITTLSLANNHSYNFGQSGLDQTRQTLEVAGLNYFGDPKNKSGFINRQTINGKTISFIGYIGLVSEFPAILDDVALAHKRGDYVIVMAHWGTEYNLNASSRQRTDAHALIDAGADMIIGAHPHVVEPVEIYNGKFIAYSLGNFIFDQYFSFDTQQGLMLKINFSDGQTKISFIPLDLTKSQPKIDDEVNRTKMLLRLAKDSLVTESQRAEIETGKLTLNP